jgi:hypothetical protein
VRLPESSSEPPVVVKGTLPEVRFPTASAVDVAAVILAFPRVVRPVTPSVPLNVPFPPVKVPTVMAFEKRFVDEAVVEKSVVEVAFVSVTFPVNVFAPENVLVSERSDEEAAVTVMESPLAKVVPFTVPRVPLMYPLPIEVVATT